MTSCDCHIEAPLSLLIHLCLHQNQGLLISLHNCSSHPKCNQLPPRKRGCSQSLQQDHKGLDRATHKEHKTISICSHLHKNGNKGVDHATHEEHTTISICSHLNQNLNLND